MAARGALHTGADEVATHTRRQIALRLLPFVFVLYITNYLDRTNVAYAALEMSHDLGFSDRVFGLGAGIFFVGYVALQIPGALLVELWSARRCITVIMVAWGSLTILTGLVHGAGQLYLARFVLGAAEAGFFPGVIVYLSHWFIREDRAKATGNFMAAIPLSFVIGSPLAGWILGHHWLGLEGWRWLFALEGLPAVLLGIVAFFYLTDWPTQASWLRPQQRDWIVRTLEQEKPADVGSVSMWRALGSRPVLLLSAAAFLEYFVFYTVAFWFPTILKRASGLATGTITLLVAIPYLAALTATLLNSWHSDRRQERRWHVAGPLFVGSVALFLAIGAGSHLWIQLGFFTIFAACVHAYQPCFWALPTITLGEYAAAASIGLINALGNLGGFAGPFMLGYFATRTGSFTGGLVWLLANLVVAGILVLFLRGFRLPQT